MKKTKTKKPVIGDKAKKAVQKAQMGEAENAVLLRQTQDWLADVAADIAVSPIDDGYKAMFLYSIAQGTFDEDLHARFLELVAEYRQGLLTEEEQLKAEIARLENEQDRVNRELGVAAVGACQEIEAAVVHIVKKTTLEVENVGERKAKEKIAEIRKKLAS